MLTLHTKIAAADVTPDTAVAQLELPYVLREKSRLRAKLSDGREVAVFTARGSVLRDGDLLTGAEGVVVRVVAAREPGYLIRCPDPMTLLRCAFHLGNRHTQAQVGNGFLRIRRDPVLKDMLLGLGASAGGRGRFRAGVRRLWRRPRACGWRSPAGAGRCAPENPPGA